MRIYDISRVAPVLVPRSPRGGFTDLSGRKHPAQALTQWDAGDWERLAPGLAPFLYEPAEAPEGHRIVETREEFDTDDWPYIVREVAVTTEAIPAASYPVSKLTIVKRLQAAGKWVDVRAFFTSNEDALDRWNAASYIDSDDPEVLAVLAAIGADPTVILAPE